MKRDESARSKVIPFPTSSSVVRHGPGKMAQAVTQNFENWQAKLDKILHEKNPFTDLLEKAEAKTGLKRLHLVLGKLRFCKGEEKLSVHLLPGFEVRKS